MASAAIKSRVGSMGDGASNAISGRMTQGVRKSIQDTFNPGMLDAIRDSLMKGKRPWHPNPNLATNPVAVVWSWAAVVGWGYVDACG